MQCNRISPPFPDAMSSLPTFSLGPQSSSLQLEFSKETLWDRSCLRPRCGPFAEELRAGPLDFATFSLTAWLLGTSLRWQLPLRMPNAIHLNLLFDSEVRGHCHWQGHRRSARTPPPQQHVAGHFQGKLSASGLRAAWCRHRRCPLLAAPPKPICCCSMEAIAELEDPQVGLKLLRSCAAHTRMTHGLRGAPRPSNPRLARLRPQSPAF